MENRTLTNPVILFDGVCALCNGFVKFVLRFDNNKKIKLASLQSHAAKTLLATHLPDLPPLSSIVLIENDKAYLQSDAAIRIFTLVGGIFSVATALKIIPRFIRDFLYNLVAKYRYNVFGKLDSCPMPSVSERERFLEDGF